MLPLPRGALHCCTDIDNFERDPNSLQNIRRKLTTVGNDVVLLEEILSYIEETVQLASFASSPDPTDDAVTAKLYDILKLEQTHTTLKLRTTDMKKNITGCMHKIETLREQCQVISERQMLQFQEAMKANTKNLEDVFKAAERSGSSLEIMQLLMSGTLAFEILDRCVPCRATRQAAPTGASGLTRLRAPSLPPSLPARPPATCYDMLCYSYTDLSNGWIDCSMTGEWSVVETGWAKAWIVEPFMSTPFLWFFINILLWVTAASGLQLWMRKLNDHALSILVMSIKLDLPLDVPHLKQYLATKQLSEESLELTGVVQTRKVAWKEADPALWLGFSPPLVELMYEELNGFLLSCNLTFDKSKDEALPEDRLRLAFFSDLQRAKVLGGPPILAGDDDDPPPAIAPAIAPAPAPAPAATEAAADGGSGRP